MYGIRHALDFYFITHKFTVLFTSSSTEIQGGRKVVYSGHVLMTVITAPFQKEGHLFNKHLLHACSND